ncbi:MAG: Rrf2 family transcriptional regulator [Candidatus Omnitrophota bacterium]|nr:Rrf2 family transcriptional regulator [Candidatus Omnitrophota bacterium]
MFNFTTALSYGLRLLLNLALEGKRPKQLKKIAKEENISLPYLRKLIPSLERAGFIRSLKGPGGGFMLTRKPSQIPLLGVINILSKDRMRHCLKDPVSCLRRQDCLTRDLWEEVHKKTEGIFRNKTLETIISKKNK